MSSNTTLLLGLGALAVGIFVFQQRKAKASEHSGTTDAPPGQLFTVGQEVRVVFPDNTASPWFLITNVRVTSSGIVYDEINQTTGERVTVTEAQVRASLASSPGSIVQVR